MEIKFRAQIKQGGELRPLKLTTEQYCKLGQVMIATNKKRIAKGINIYGQTAKPLNPRYAKQKAKIRHTRNPIRDLKLTGLTLRSFQVTRAYGGVVRCEPKGAIARERAYFSQFREPLIGFTTAEQDAVTKEVRRMYGRNASLLWTPIRLGQRY